jgi:hypothetical protein
MLTTPYSLFNSMLNRKFPITMATGGRLKIAKNHYFALFLSIKTDFKVLQFLNELRLKVKGFSASVTSYPNIDLRPF